MSEGDPRPEPVRGPDRQEARPGSAPSPFGRPGADAYTARPGDGGGPRRRRWVWTAAAAVLFAVAGMAASRLRPAEKHRFIVQQGDVGDMGVDHIDVADQNGRVRAIRPATTRVETLASPTASQEPQIFLPAAGWREFGAEWPAQETLSKTDSMSQVIDSHGSSLVTYFDKSGAVLVKYYVPREMDFGTEKAAK